jgi:hypothetical protein
MIRGMDMNYFIIVCSKNYIENMVLAFRLSTDIDF